MKREEFVDKMRSFIYLKGIEDKRYVLCVQRYRAEGSDNLVCDLQRES
jgi:hypothetical protein